MQTDFLAHIDWNTIMKNKMVTESLTILKIELHIVINVPIKKREKQSKRKHLSKEAFRKIIYKEDNMWRVSLDRQLA